MSNIDSVECYTQQWRNWQSHVITLVQRELADLSDGIHHDDFDWEAWRSYFDAGYLPIEAVGEAISLRVSVNLLNLSYAPSESYPSSSTRRAVV